MEKKMITLDGQNYGIAFTTAKIDFPEYADLKSNVDRLSEEYSQFKVTPENMKEAKLTRANLNKLKKALNDRKIDIVKAIDEPVNNLKGQIKGLTEEIDQTSNQISVQIKRYEDHARQMREQSLMRDLEKRCKAAGVDYAKVEINPKWFNKTASYAVFEKEVQTQIDVLLREKEELAENMKVVTARAKELGLPHEHWVQMLMMENTKLSDVLAQMSSYAEDIKAEAERNEKAKKEQREKLVNQNGKAIDKTTGEIVDSFQEAFLITDKGKFKLTATSHQFKQLSRFIKTAGIKCEQVRDAQ
ncbi:MAG: DUF1351 domain-containing protein [Bombilactobacillus sp.]